jgi:hypothetical protein
MNNEIRRIVSEIQYDNAPLHMLGQGDFKTLKLRFKYDPVLGHEVCTEALRRLSNNKRSSSPALRSAARKKWRQLRADFAAQIVGRGLPMPEYEPVVIVSQQANRCFAYAQSLSGRRRGRIERLIADREYCQRYATLLASELNKEHA